MIGGHCDPRFARVREVFTESFEDKLALGAAVAIAVDGKLVVDLFGGFADGKRTRPWERDTIVNVFSVTKAWTAICAHRLVDQGLLDLEAPVSKYWPEFARAGKAEITVRALLTHRAGLPALREFLPPATLFDWNAMTAALAAEAPWWEPESKHGYHAVTFGWLVGEVIRRVAGKTVGAYLRDEIAGPLGLDLQIGVDAADDARIAELRSGPRPETPTLLDRVMAAPDSMVARAFTNPFASVPATTQTRAWRGAELPATNGHSDARSVARLYGELDRVLSHAAIARANTEHASGLDAVLDVETRFGLGFMLTQSRKGAAFGPNPRSFGHPGMGGSVGFADPDARVGFGYVTNRMGSSILLDPRATTLIDALYASIS